MLCICVYPMSVASKAQSDRRKVGPYSRTLRRGVIGTYTIDGRSTTGRYVRDLEAQLIAHCGGSPTITQKLLIERLVRTTLQLNALVLRELGLKGAAERAPSLADLFPGAAA